MWLFRKSLIINWMHCGRLVCVLFGVLVQRGMKEGGEQQVHKALSVGTVINRQASFFLEISQFCQNFLSNFDVLFLNYLCLCVCMEIAPPPPKKGSFIFIE